MNSGTVSIRYGLISQLFWNFDAIDSALSPTPSSDCIIKVSLADFVVMGSSDKRTGLHRVLGQNTMLKHTGIIEFDSIFLSENNFKCLSFHVFSYL